MQMTIVKFLCDYGKMLLLAIAVMVILTMLFRLTIFKNIAVFNEMKESKNLLESLASTVHEPGAMDATDTECGSDMTIVVMNCINGSGCIVLGIEPENHKSEPYPINGFEITFGGNYSDIIQSIDNIAKECNSAVMNKCRIESILAKDRKSRNLICTISIRFLK